MRKGSLELLNKLEGIVQVDRVQSLQSRQTEEEEEDREDADDDECEAKTKRPAASQSDSIYQKLTNKTSCL